MNPQHENELGRILAARFDLELSEDGSWEQLMSALRAGLLHLLDRDFGRLVNLMYRLDIPERKFKEAMEAGSQAEIAARLAEIVLEREVQRIEIRNKYKSGEDRD